MLLQKLGSSRSSTGERKFSNFNTKLPTVYTSTPVRLPDFESGNKSQASQNREAMEMGLAYKNTLTFQEKIVFAT